MNCGLLIVNPFLTSRRTPGAKTVKRCYEGVYMLNRTSFRTCVLYQFILDREERWAISSVHILICGMGWAWKASFFWSAPIVSRISAAVVFLMHMDYLEWMSVSCILSRNKRGFSMTCFKFSLKIRSYHSRRAKVSENCSAV